MASAPVQAGTATLVQVVAARGKGKARGVPTPSRVLQAQVQVQAKAAVRVKASVRRILTDTRAMHPAFHPTTPIPVSTLTAPHRAPHVQPARAPTGTNVVRVGQAVALLVIVPVAGVRAVAVRVAAITAHAAAAESADTGAGVDDHRHPSRVPAQRHPLGWPATASGNAEKVMNAHLTAFALHRAFVAQHSLARASRAPHHSARSGRS